MCQQKVMIDLDVIRKVLVRHKTEWESTSRDTRQDGIEKTSSRRSLIHILNKKMKQYLKLYPHLLRS